MNGPTLNETETNKMKEIHEVNVKYQLAFIEEVMDEEE
jgi:hypothetical protein